MLTWGRAAKPSPLGAIVCLALLIPCLNVAAAQDLRAAFEQANKLYEEMKFTEAVAAYEQLVQAGHVSAALCFNLGNAYFKSGQLGRAIAAYRQAETLSPRDPDLQANLQFVRKNVVGATPRKPPFWRRALTTLTANEWTWVTCGFGWSWFILLAARQWRPGLIKTLSGYTAGAGVLFGICLVCTLSVLRLERSTTWAVVIAREAVVRYGPLSASPTFYLLHDGAEARVLDQDRDWLQIIDDAKRKGWVESAQVLVLRPDGTAATPAPAARGP